MTDSPAVHNAVAGNKPHTNGNAAAQDESTLTGYSTVSPTATAASSSSATTHSIPNQIVHLINDDGQFSCSTAELNTLVQSACANSATSTYSIVGIMGCQSTGKSTLLNLLFGTSFGEMDAHKGRSQTTKGIWLDSGSRSDDIIVLDLEGTDSGERGEDRTTFERQTALYALSLAEILLINMWEHDIGRYTASNYGILKTVFEVNLDIFQPNVKTALLFIIRDHNEEETPFTAIETKIRTEVDRIWSELRKPQKFANTTIEELFVLRYVGLPHKNYQKKAFEAAVEQLKQRFIDPSLKGDYLLADESHGAKAVSTNDFGQYAQQLWQTIQSNKALDLPSQREMLATFRCDEITQQLVSELQQSTAALKQQISTQGIVPTFGADVTQHLTTALQTYTTQTTHYQPDIVKRKQAELYERLSEVVYPLFKVQVSKLISNEGGRFSVKLKDEVKSLSPDDYSQFYPIAERCSAESTQVVDKTIDQLNVPIMQWNVEDFHSQWQLTVSDMVLIQRADQLAKLQAYTERQLKRQLAPQTADILRRAEPSMWRQLAELHQSTLQTHSEQLTRQLRALKASPSEIQQMISALQADIHDIIRSAVEQHATLILLHMRNRFDKRFRYDKDGVLRRWKPHHKIRDLYFECREDAVAMQKMFAVWRLDQHIKQLSSGSPQKVKTIDSADTTATPDATDDITDNDDLSLDDSDIPADQMIIPAAKRNENELQFTHDIEGALRDAELEQERSTQQLKVPMWAVVAMLFLGWNEIMTVLRNPLLLVLVVILGGGVYLLWSLNMLSPAITVARSSSQAAIQQIARLVNQYVNVQELEASTGIHLPQAFHQQQQEVEMPNPSRPVSSSSTGSERYGINSGFSRQPSNESTNGTSTISRRQTGKKEL